MCDEEEVEEDRASRDIQALMESLDILYGQLHYHLFIGDTNSVDPNTGQAVSHAKSTITHINRTN